MTVQVHDALAEVSVDDLQPFPGNARTHDLGVLMQSLSETGQYRPLVVRWHPDDAQRHNVVLAGNGTLEAARALGWERILASYVECSDPVARRINLVDNRANDLAGYDDRALLSLLEDSAADLAGLVGTGYTDDDLQRLLGPRAGFQDSDAVPEPLPEAKTRRGDVWLLGEHRLLCGDATDPASYKTLFDGDPRLARLLVTDPPYGVDYQGVSLPRVRLRNDALKGAALVGLLGGSLRAAVEHLASGSSVYMFVPSGAQQFEARQAWNDVGLHTQGELVWVKQRISLSRWDFNPQHEGILYGWTPGRHRWYGPTNASTVLAFARPSRSPDHPTAKPVALLADLIGNSSRVGDGVVDMFAGSGSTLIAAHTLDRRARLVELEPAYCDVICRRFQRFTGILPRLAETGEEHDFDTTEGE